MKRNKTAMKHSWIANGLACLRGVAVFCLLWACASAVAQKISFTPGVINTYAGYGAAGGGVADPNGGALGNGGPATQATMNWPSSVALDQAGNLYILDSGNYQVREVTPAGVISTIAGSLQSGHTGDGGPAVNALFGAYAGGIATHVNQQGQTIVYVSDSSNNAIRAINMSTGIITTVAGVNGSAAGFSGDGNLATLATLNNPIGIYVDVNGNLYIADSGNNAIREVAASTGIITTIAGMPGGGTVCASHSDAYGDGCPATQAALHAPTGVWADSTTPFTNLNPANLYIADSENYVIRVVNLTTGIIRNYAGTITVNATTGVTTSTQGHSDSTNPLTATFGGGTGALGAGFLPGSNAEFYNAATNNYFFPMGQLYVDPVNEVFLADAYNSQIRRMLPPTTSSVNAVAGNASAGTLGGLGGGGSAIATAVSNKPFGVALDNNGNIYIADTLNNEVRKVDVTNSVMAFGAVNTNTTSSQTVTIVNTGNAPLSFSSMTFSSTTYFNYTGTTTTCKTTATVAPGASCVIAITFTPADSGGPATATFTIVSNALNAASTSSGPTSVIQLVGTGYENASVSSQSSTRMTVVTTLPGSNVATTSQGFSVTVNVTNANTAISVTPTGSIQLQAGAINLGTAALNSSGNATFTFTKNPLPAQPETVTATYSGDYNYKGNTSSIVIYTYAKPPDFGFFTTASYTTSSPLTVGIVSTTGGTSSAGVPLYLYSLNGFTDMVGLSCTGLPGGATCYFGCPATSGVTCTSNSPAIPFVALNAGVNLNTPSSIMIITTAQSLSSLEMRRTLNYCGLALGGVLLIVLPTRKRKVIQLLLVALLGTGLAVLQGCSNTKSFAVTPGNYTVVVTASDGTATHTITIPVNIHQ